MDQYRKKYKWILEKGTSEKDKALEKKKEETDDERILDLALIMDLTSSMGPYIEISKDTLKKVIEDTMINYPDLEVRVAFVGYRDFCDTKNIFYIHDFTFDLDHMKETIGKQQAIGGGDSPEDVQGGLRQVLDLSFRENSIKLAYFIADAPCHGSKYHTGHDGNPQGNPHGLVLEELVREFSDREIDLSCYKLTDQTETMFKIMEKSYNEGKYKGDFQFVDLRREVQKAQTDRSMVDAGGLRSSAMKGSYAAQTSSDMLSRMTKHSKRKGW